MATSEGIKADRDLANRILKDPELQKPPDQILALARRLANHRCIEHARRLAEHLQKKKGLSTRTAIEVRQKWAMWTSKNPDGPDDSKHEDALEILDGIQEVPGGASLATTTDQETLGIAGGICKRHWLANGQLETLERSLAYYERGVAQGIVGDNGYTAINTAFVLDLLDRVNPADTAVRSARAQELRRQILEELLPLANEPAGDSEKPRKDERWFHETIAEAYFGLDQYDAAVAQLGQVNWAEVEKWEYETTARQFAWLARLRDPMAESPEDFQRSRAWSALRRCFGDRAVSGAASLFAGKFGLALSGGGFRASFFHIGVLAALADLDVLKHVEVLSCVSGGSVLGAHYYLEIRKLLQDKQDGDITRKMYIEVVERVASKFLEGVQKNIRTRVALNFLANLRMLFSPGYTRTNRLGELYEKHLYAHVQDREAGKVPPRKLRELTIRPSGDEDCLPKYDNWTREHKVPILILNATTLNTGHNWQFTATWMGEPPAQIETDVDGNYRLRRMYIDDPSIGRHRDIRIGQAVAASSCVSGLFAPLELRGLYDGKTVRLVDGGLHDNQGIYGLFDQNCSVIFASDASGQMEAVDEPGDDVFSVSFRSLSVSMARVRTAQYRELQSRLKSGRLTGLMFVHLKKGLSVDEVDWNNCKDVKPQKVEHESTTAKGGRQFRILEKYQRLIANIRTDLDSFNKTEAFALMLSGYEMVHAEFKDTIKGYPTCDDRHNWEFLEVAPVLYGKAPQEEQARVEKILSVARKRALKVWYLSPTFQVLGTVIGLAVVIAACWLAYLWHEEPLLSPKGLVSGAVGLVLVASLGSLGLGGILKIVRYRKTFQQVLVGGALCLFGSVLSAIHVWIVDPFFLARGKRAGARSRGPGATADSGMRESRRPHSIGV